MYTLFAQTADQTVANTTTETTLFFSGAGTLTLPANFFVVGKTIQFYLGGFHSSTGNPTATINIKLGGTTIATGTLTSGNGSNDGFTIFGALICRSTGGSGTISCKGVFTEEHTGGGLIGLVSTTATTIDTTATQTFDVTITWGTADAGNTITNQIGVLEVNN